jgi:hypothetical protein
MPSSRVVRCLGRRHGPSPSSFELPDRYTQQLLPVCCRRQQGMTTPPAGCGGSAGSPADSAAVRLVRAGRYGRGGRKRPPGAPLSRYLFRHVVRQRSRVAADLRRVGRAQPANAADYWGRLQRGELDPRLSVTAKEARGDGAPGPWARVCLTWVTRGCATRAPRSQIRTLIVLLPTAWRYRQHSVVWTVEPVVWAHATKCRRLLVKAVTRRAGFSLSQQRKPAAMAVLGPGPLGEGTPCVWVGDLPPACGQGGLRWRLCCWSCSRWSG